MGCWTPRLEIVLTNLKVGGSGSEREEVLLSEEAH